MRSRVYGDIKYYSIFVLTFLFIFISLYKNFHIIYPSGDQATELGYIFDNARGHLWFHGQDIDRLKNLSGLHPYFPGPFYYWYLAVWALPGLYLFPNLTYLFLTLGGLAFTLVALALSGKYWSRFTNCECSKYIFILFFLSLSLLNRSRANINIINMYTPHFALVLMGAALPLSLLVFRDKKRKDIYALVVLSSLLWQVQLETAIIGAFYGFAALYLLAKGRDFKGILLYIFMLSPLIIRYCLEGNRFILSYLKIEDGGGGDQIKNIYRAYMNLYKPIPEVVIIILIILQILLILYSTCKGNLHIILAFIPLYLTLYILFYNHTHSPWNDMSTYAFWWNYLFIILPILFFLEKVISDIRIWFIASLLIVPTLSTLNPIDISGRTNLFSRSLSSSLPSIPQIGALYSKITEVYPEGVIELSTPTGSWKSNYNSSENAIFQSLFIEGQVRGREFCSFDNVDLPVTSICSKGSGNKKVYLLYGEEIFDSDKYKTFLGTVGEVYLYAQ